MRPLSLMRPKSLIPMHGIPMASFGLRSLIRSGCTVIGVNGWHFAGQVKNWLAEEAKFFPKIDFRFFAEQQLLGTGGGLAALLEQLPDGPVLVQNGDVIHDWDAKKILSTLESTEIRLVLTTRTPVVEFDHGRILSLRDANRSNRGYSGIHLMGNGARREIISRSQFDLVKCWQEMIESGGIRFSGEEHAGLWEDLGQIEEYFAAHVSLWQKPAYQNLCRNLQLKPAWDDKRKISPGLARLHPESENSILVGQAKWRGVIRDSIIVNPCPGAGRLEGEVLL